MNTAPTTGTTAPTGLDRHILALQEEEKALKAQLEAKQKELADKKKLDKAAYDLGYAEGFADGQKAKKVKAAGKTGGKSGTRLDDDQKADLKDAILKVLTIGEPTEAEDFKTRCKTLPNFTAHYYGTFVEELVKWHYIRKTGEKNGASYTRLK